MQKQKQTKILTLDDLKRLPDPVSLGPRHYPIGHYEFISRVMGGLRDAKLKVASQDIRLLDRRNQIFATFHIEGQDEMTLPGGVKFMIGAKGSINRTIAEMLCFGSHVIVCENGMFVGEHVIGAKNTPNILQVLPPRIAEVLSAFTQFRETQVQQYSRLVDVDVSDRVAHDFICNITRQGEEIIPKGMIADVITQWHEPDHNWGDKTAWRLYNAASHVAKTFVDRNPVVGSDRTMALHDLFVAAFAPDLPQVVEDN